MTAIALRARYGQARGVRRPRVPPERVRTFGVLAGAYRARGDERTLLTHSCETDARGRPLRTLCGKVKPDNIFPDWDEPFPPTCPICLQRDPRYFGLKS